MKTLINKTLSRTLSFSLCLISSSLVFANGGSLTRSVNCIGYNLDPGNLRCKRDACNLARLGASRGCILAGWQNFTIKEKHKTTERVEYNQEKSSFLHGLLNYGREEYTVQKYYKIAYCSVTYTCNNDR